MISTQNRSSVSDDFPLEEIDLNEIVKNVYLGDRHCTKHRRFLKILGIKYIIVAGQQLTSNFPQDFTYYHLNIKDSATEPINLHFQSVCQFIDQALNEGEAVFVHCAFGVSRSSTLIIAYVIKKYRIGFEEAYAFVKRKRSVIKPNRGFEEQLREWAQLVRKAGK